MQNEEPTLGAVLKEFNLTSDESKRLAVSVLSLIHEAKKAGMPLDGSEAPPTPPVKDVLFELAKLHVNTAAQIAKVNATFTNKMVDFLRARRRHAEHARPGSRELVLMKTPAAGGLPTGKLKLDKGPKERTYKLPKTVEFIGFKDDAPGSFAGLNYDATGFVLKVPASTSGGQAELTITLGEHIFEKGRYRATTVLDSDDGTPIELILEMQKA